MTSGPLVGSGALAQTLASNYNPFGWSSAPTDGAVHPAVGAAGRSDETLWFMEPMHSLGMPCSSLDILHAAQDAPEPGTEPPAMQRGVGMLGSEYTVGNIMGTGDAPASLFGANAADVNPFLSVSPQIRNEDIICSDSNKTITNSTNPFLI